jgi:tetratricopeptide (TPR) repeat protein
MMAVKSSMMNTRPDFQCVTQDSRRQDRRSSRTGKLRYWLVAIFMLGTLIGVLLWWRIPASPDVAIRMARKHLYQRHAEQALNELAPFLNHSSPDGNVCFIAAEAYSELKDFPAAAAMFARVPAEHSKRAEACFRAGDIFLLQLSQLTKAEENLLEAIKLNPTHQAAQAHLAAMYGLCGLTSLTTDIRLERVRSGQFTEVDLVLLALGDTAAENANALKGYEAKSPDDPLTKLAMAHRAWQHNEFSEARRLYETGLQFRPDLHDAQARLGRVFMELNDADAFLRWHSGLPTDADESAEIWAVRGDWSIRQKDLSGAVRCYWEAAHRDPGHRRSVFQLGQTLASLGEKNKAQAFQYRNDVLQQLLLTAKHYNLNPAPESLLRTLDATIQCGHPWEAWGWAEVLRKRFPRHAQVVQSVERPSPESPRVNFDSRPAETTTFADYAVPDWMLKMSGSQSSSDLRMHELQMREQQVSTHSSIRFSDDALQAGLEFEYLHGDEMPGPGMRMFQFSGGGTGVIDYDLDGWPDVYLTQGGRWPLPESPLPSDALFRNQRGKSFQEVATTAGVLETHYSQGLAVGDIDGDGWSDVFVANVDGNTLFRNNGDGTFEDITESAGVTDNAWSTSAVLADFNGDALPDLYVVNYLEGSDLLDRICHQSDGTPRACTPHEFDAAEDQLLLNLGDGRFRDVSREAGILAPGGKGLGVIAADFDGTGRLSVFVGNDTTANFFFHNQTPQSDAIPQFVESAVINGLAFDRDGKTQACMGIAAGDANRDGLIDLFVTNYYNESNTLYQGQSGMVFSDQTAEAGLREPGIRQLGFGSQFLDADVDGHLDLIVTNGHVDDETARNIPLHMPTQFFRNTGNATFTEVPAASLGPWFSSQYLGRGVAKLDWNRDGRIDVLVGMLDSPSALLTNESEPVGKSISLKLVAKNSAREAIGTSVSLTTKENTVTCQLTAGDGYQSSNERTLHFAVADAEQVTLTIRWPSGEMDHVTTGELTGRSSLIEGRGVPIVLPE